MKSGNSAESNIRRIRRFVIPLAHAALWVAALAFGLVVGASNMPRPINLMASCMIVYCAFMFEAFLISWDIEAANAKSIVEFSAFGFQKWMFLNIATTILFIVLLVVYKSDWYLYAIIMTAGWLKYIVSSLPGRIEKSVSPYYTNRYKGKDIIL